MSTYFPPNIKISSDVKLFVHKVWIFHSIRLKGIRVNWFSIVISTAQNCIHTHIHTLTGHFFFGMKRLFVQDLLLDPTYLMGQCDNIVWAKALYFPTANEKRKKKQTTRDIIFKQLSRIMSIFFLSVTIQLQWITAIF